VADEIIHTAEDFIFLKEEKEILLHFFQVLRKKKV